MRKLPYVMVIVLMLFAFTACNGNNEKHSEEVPHLGQMLPNSNEMTDEETLSTELSAEEPKPNYTRLTQGEWDGHGYSFFVTSVKEQENYFLIRGVLSKSFFTPEEFGYIQNGDSIVINGETFFFEENPDQQVLMGLPRFYGYLHNILENRDSIGIWGNTWDGSDSTQYNLTLANDEHGTRPVHRTIDRYRQIRVHKETEVHPILHGPISPLSAVEVLTGFTPHSFEDGLIVSGLLWFAFSDGKVIQIQSFLSIDLESEREQVRQTAPADEISNLSEHSIIVNGVGLSPMYNHFTLDGETSPSHVPLFPLLYALGLSDISAGSQIAVQNQEGNFIAALNIVNYLAFNDDVIDMSSVGLDDVFMAKNFGIYAPLSLFREMGFSAYVLGGHVFIYGGDSDMH